MVQSTIQDRVLFEIQQFLADQGIVGHLHISNLNYVTKDGRNAQLRTLSIGSSSSLIKFLEGVLPYLIVKKSKATEALKLARQVQARKDATAERLKKCEKEYVAGISAGVLCRRYGLATKRLKAHLVQSGIKIRGYNEAAQNRWKNHSSVPT